MKRVAAELSVIVVASSTVDDVVDADVSETSVEVFSISSTVAGAFVVPSVDNDTSMAVDGSVSIGSTVDVES